MMDQYFITFLLIGACVPLVSSRHDYQNDYYEYYHNKHHKVSSTTSQALSTTDDASLEEIESSSEGSHRTKVNINETVLQYGGDSSSTEMRTVFMIRIGIIVGSVVAFVCILGCVLCCCPSCCRGKPRPGFIIANNRDEQTAQLPISAPYPQQPVAGQHFPSNYPQDQPPQFPPQYTPEPGQQYPSQYMPQPGYQQSQYSPVHQQPQYSPVQPQNQYSPTAPLYNNPPEAPPPYDTSSLAPKY